MTYNHNTQKKYRTKWTKEEIRTARRQLLKPVLEQLGYRLKPQGAGNYRIINLPEKVIIKECYWMNYDDNSSGNAIDFFVKICGKKFSEAMEILQP